MSKVCILGDTHFGMRSDSLDFHKYNEKFYTDVFFPYLLKNNITEIYQLGDLFDRRKFINFLSLYLSRKYFFDILKKHNIQLHTLLGNHDVVFKNTLKVNSTSMLLNEYDNVHLYDKFSTIQIDNIDIDVIPWICEENESQIFDLIKQSKSQICLGHFNIAGFEMDRGNVQHDGIDRQSLSKYDMVLTGHFHHKSSDGHIFYVGTPVEMTWADYNDPKGFHIFDTHTRELEFVANPYCMFNKILYDDSKSDFEVWKSYDFNALKETYVKMVVLNKQNPYLFESVMDNLYKSGAADVNIVEDFTDTTVIENDKEIVDQAQDTITILNKYIDNLTLNCDVVHLKQIMREVYIEAINLESSA